MKHSWFTVTRVAYVISIKRCHLLATPPFHARIPTTQQCSHLVLRSQSPGNEDASAIASHLLHAVLWEALHLEEVCVQHQVLFWDVLVESVRGHCWLHWQMPFWERKRNV